METTAAILRSFKPDNCHSVVQGMVRRRLAPGREAAGASALHAGPGRPAGHGAS